MKYRFSNKVKEDEKLRESFNELAQRVFGFNLIDWYNKGHWSDKYIPHVLINEDGKVISNVSVNLMRFTMGGESKNFIQLGTVMTDPDYQRQGLNRYLLERILEEYKEKVDGFYLFANDTVLDYYPKFGFKPIKETYYSFQVDGRKDVTLETTLPGYQIEKVDIAIPTVSQNLYQLIEELDTISDPNDGFRTYENLGLYQFHLAADLANSVYYLPELNGYILANYKDGVLSLHQTISSKPIDMERLSASFEEEISEIRFGYTPVHKEKYIAYIEKPECTLFVIGPTLERVEIEKMRFPTISHA